MHQWAHTGMYKVTATATNAVSQMAVSNNITVPVTVNCTHSKAVTPLVTHSERNVETTCSGAGASYLIDYTVLVHGLQSDVTYFLFTKNDKSSLRVTKL